MTLQSSNGMIELDHYIKMLEMPLGFGIIKVNQERETFLKQCKEQEIIYTRTEIMQKE